MIRLVQLSLLYHGCWGVSNSRCAVSTKDKGSSPHRLAIVACLGKPALFRGLRSSQTGEIRGRRSIQHGLVLPMLLLRGRGTLPDLLPRRSDLRQVVLFLGKLAIVHSHVGVCDLPDLLYAVWERFA